MTSLRFGSATDVGLVRTNNQDQLLVDPPLFAVADGMGGHAAGEVAALTAIQSLKDAFRHDRTSDGLVVATKEANRSVWQRAQSQSTMRGMGTTLVALALVNDGGDEQLAIVNVGDSRVYLLRQGELEQLTTDHSLVQALIDDGQLSEAEADIHPQRHVLTRALGIDPEVPVDVVQVLPVKGDRFLLCSDGLTKEVDDDKVASILRRTRQPAAAARELVKAARAHGGSDNITVVVVDVVDDNDQALADSEALAGDQGVVIPHDEMGKGDGDDEGGARQAGRSRRTRERLRPTRRAITFRVVLFMVVVLALFGLAVGAVGYYARGSYYVGIRQSQIVIFKGRPGGLLWFKPTVEEKTSVLVSGVLTSRLPDLQDGKEESTLAAARQYVHNLQAEADAHQVASTPPSSTP
jgi:serine/threonine protein phosphatase PrpC